ncbi:MAG: YidC/Oxa1 family membrane protein insertase [Synergistaceae bacterium]|nr:YidC/Oxa1 family membrane protein insertase [Synergistaceae bacterium]
MLLQILEFFYGLTNSFGLSIVLLTIVVRIVLYPLNQKQMTSMQQMQRIQPRLKVLQEKYANDKTKLNEEMMRLYKENHVNPAAGCLPLLVQLPILILLFNVLRTYDFAGTSFMGILLGSSTTSGLAQAVGVAEGTQGTAGVLAVLNGVLNNPAGLANVGLYLPNLLLLISISFLTWAQQKLTGGDNPQMATMNTIMPIFMAFICLSMPGGVMLYWGLSSLMGVAQQYFVMKKTKEELAIKPTLHKNKPAAGTAEDEDDDEYEDDDEEEEDE